MALGFYLDGTRCIGCTTCAIACKDYKDQPVGSNFRRILNFETGEYPTARSWHYSIACNHCANPACVTACPTGAMHVNEEDGTVIHDDDICIGCKMCVESCPYGAPQYREDLAIVQKCDACADRRAEGKDPACVAACAMRALYFGDVDELKARFGEDLVTDVPYLPESSVTNPPTLIKPKEASLTDDYRQVIE